MTLGLLGGGGASIPLQPDCAGDSRRHLKMWEPGSPAFEVLKQRPDVQVVEVTQANRGELPAQIAAWVKESASRANTP
jgi:hypothetical protein